MRPSPIDKIVDDRADDDGHAHVGHAPVVADLPLFEEAHHAGGRAQRHRAPAGEEDAVNLIERAHRLQHHAKRFARRRAVVVHAGRRGLVKQDGGAAGGAARIGEVPDAQAADVGQRSRRRRAAWAGRPQAAPMPDRRQRGGAADALQELTPETSGVRMRRHSTRSTFGCSMAAPCHPAEPLPRRQLLQLLGGAALLPS